jgi:hypothetical protein
MVIHKELDVRNLREENRTLREALGKRYSHPNVVARSPKMQEVLATWSASRRPTRPCCSAAKVAWAKI